MNAQYQIFWFALPLVVIIQIPCWRWNPGALCNSGLTFSFALVLAGVLAFAPFLIYLNASIPTCQPLHALHSWSLWYRRSFHSSFWYLKTEAAWCRRASSQSHTAHSLKMDLSSSSRRTSGSLYSTWGSSISTAIPSSAHSCDDQEDNLQLEWKHAQSAVLQIWLKLLQMLAQVKKRNWNPEPRTNVAWRIHIRLVFLSLSGAYLRHAVLRSSTVCLPFSVSSSSKQC